MIKLNNKLWMGEKWTTNGNKNVDKKTGKREDVTSDEDKEAASYTGTNADESNEGSKPPRNSMKQASWGKAYEPQHRGHRRGLKDF